MLGPKNIMETLTLQALFQARSRYLQNPNIEDESPNSPGEGSDSAKDRAHREHLQRRRHRAILCSSHLPDEDCEICGWRSLDPYQLWELGYTSDD